MDLKKRLILKSIRAWSQRAGVYGQESKPLLLKGARQVGKTHTLRQVGQNDFADFHYINFLKDQSLKTLFEGDLDPHKIISQMGILRGETIVPGKTLLILDEIQEAPRALAALKNFKEDLSDLHVVACGSHLGVHLNNESYPVGQVYELEMFPLTYLEFASNFLSEEMMAILQNFSLQSEIPEPFHEIFWKLFIDYLCVGGMPEVVATYKQLLQNQPDQKSEVMAAIRNTQNSLVTGYSADFAKHAGKTNAVHIEKIFRALPMQLGRAVDSSVSRFRYKDALGTKATYSRLANPIEWLEKAQLILRSFVIDLPEQPLKAHLKESLFKLYLLDVGLLGALMDLPMVNILSQDYGTFKGFYAENFVAQELRAQGLYPFYNWVRNTSEVEFILSSQVSGNVLPLEVKSGFSQKSKSLSVYREKYAPNQAVKLSAHAYRAARGGQTESKKLINLPLYMAWYLARM